jgi:uncharacterized protein (DUF1778 family)
MQALPMTRGGPRPGAGRPAIGNAKNRRVMLRLSNDEYAAIKKAATSARKQVSAWIRETCLKRTEMGK